MQLTVSGLLDKYLVSLRQGNQFDSEVGLCDLVGVSGSYVTVHQGHGTGDVPKSVGRIVHAVLSWSLFQAVPKWPSSTGPCGSAYRGGSREEGKPVSLVGGKVKTTRCPSPLLTIIHVLTAFGLIASSSLSLSCPPARQQPFITVGYAVFIFVNQ